MKIYQTLEVLRQSGDPGTMLLLLTFFFCAIIVMALMFRQPFLICLILIIGSCYQLQWSTLNVIGLIGKYPLLCILAIAGIAMKGRFKSTYLSYGYLVFCAIICCQIIRSPAIADSIVKLFCYLLAFFGILMLSAKVSGDDVQVRRMLRWCLGWAIIMIWLQIPFMEGMNGRVNGIYMGPWSHSVVAIAVLCVLHAIVTGWTRNKMMIALCSVTVIAGIGFLILTGGRTALGATAVSVPIILWTRLKRAMLTTIIVGAITFFALTSILPSMPAFERAAEHLRSTDSSGRFEMWSIAWPQVMQSPFLGYGPEASENFGGNTFGMGLHSTYLSLAFDYGIPVAAAFVAFLLCACLRSWRMTTRRRTKGSELASLSGAWLMFMAVSGIVSGVMIQINLTWFLLCMCLGFLETETLRIHQDNSSVEMLNEYYQIDSDPVEGGVSVQVGE